MQRDMGPFEDGPGANGEVLFALVAAVEAALSDGDAIAESTERTEDTIRPKAAFEVDTSGLLIGEHFVRESNI
jgi:hypothetical protein